MKLFKRLEIKRPWNNRTVVDYIEVTDDEIIKIAKRIQAERDQEDADYSASQVIQDTIKEPIAGG